MDDYSKFLEYADKVYKQLSSQLINNHIPKGRIIRDYRIKNTNITLDLVVLKESDENKVESFYEIKSYRTILLNRLGLIHRLQYIKNSIGATSSYLAYLDDNKVLKTIDVTNENIEDASGIHSREWILKNSMPKEPAIKEISSMPEFISDNEISSVPEFISELKENIWKGDQGDSTFFYRGHSKKISECKPGVYRKNMWIENEKLMFHEAIRRCHDEFPSHMSTFDCLVKMQHYELPTRLLDITQNPLVALYFACSNDNDKDKDGEVLIFSVPNKQINYYDDEQICVLSNLSKLDNDFVFEDKKQTLIHYIRQEYPDFNDEELNMEYLDDVVCVLPRLNNQRIISQKGAFFIYGISSSKGECSQLKDEPQKIIVKAKAKKSILASLASLDISNASLFPEIDKIMKGIKDEYSRQSE